MPTDRDCIEYARDCVRLAGLAENADLRQKLLQMAREWMAAAMQEDKSPEPKTDVGLDQPSPQMDQQGKADREAS